MSAPVSSVHVPSAPGLAPPAVLPSALPADLPPWPRERQEVAGWLVAQGGRLESTQACFEALARSVAAVGPARRCWLGFLVLHPQLVAQGLIWTRDPDRVVSQCLPHGYEQSAAFLASPAWHIHQTAAPLRIRLDREGGWPALDDLRAAGHTDYYAQPLKFGAQMAATVAWSTTAPAGFAAEDIALFDALQPIASLLMQLRKQVDLADVLLRTYLGDDAGARVLRGQVKRGDGETVHAAVWFGDLRGFTSLSDALPRDALLDLLNAWFGAAVAAVQAHGGVVLKFMGDGMLAIFPAAARGQPAAARAALDAAADLAGRIAQINATRRAASLVEVRYGLGLHVGEVLYGNIGSHDRLDFTVVGPAVNRAARLEGLCSGLGVPLVVSAEFAASCPERPVVSLGRHALKGLAGAQEVFGLPP